MIIEEILNDLYKLDPTLKEYEPDLKKIITQLIAAKPNTKFDENFKIKLEKELLEKFKTITGQPIKKGLAWDKIIMGKFLYVMSGSLAIMILFVIGVSLINKTPRSADQVIKLSFEQTINQTSEKAFGALPAFQVAQDQNNHDLNYNTKKATNVTAQGGAEMMALSAPMAADDASDGGADNFSGARTVMLSKADKPASLIYRPTPQITFKYTYSGEEIKLDNQNLSVYKRNFNGGLASELGRVIGSIDTGLINLKSFPKLKTTNLSLQEDYDGGYSLNFNLDNENINLYRLYNPGVVATNCSDKTVCAPDYYISKDNLPSNDEIIGITNEFLKKHGVNLSGWGDPKVDDAWVNYEEFSKNNYAPANITVVYPQKIEDKLVYTDSGGLLGMTVNVNLKDRKVDSVYNLTSQNFIASNYPAITDWNKILDFALKGGLRPTIYYALSGGQEDKEVNLELDTPVYALVDRWVYNKTSQELFVPALIFPIKNKTFAPGYGNLNNVIVPLVEEMFPKDGENNNDGIVYPMRAGGASGGMITPQATEAATPTIKK